MWKHDETCVWRLIDMTKIKEIAWLSGLLEGEGSFIQSPNGYPKITIAMTDRDVIERAAKLFGTRCRGPYEARTPRGERAKPTYRCESAGNRAMSWMMTLWPLLGERRREKIIEISREWRKLPPRPQRRHKAKRGTATPATCHPSVRMAARGLCIRCYSVMRRKFGAIKAGRWPS